MAIRPASRANTLSIITRKKWCEFGWGLSVTAVCIWFGKYFLCVHVGAIRVQCDRSLGIHAIRASECQVIGNSIFLTPVYVCIHSEFNVEASYRQTLSHCCSH